ncbi:hypothetical protein [Nocardia sp. NPDC020380]|uniref:hypothetical protein n=1 Tax=Nocardia sp. NPDC020380 TaxID=3364309 RepID=UPI0037B04354
MPGCRFVIGYEGNAAVHPDVDSADLRKLFAAAAPEQFRALTVCDPARTTASTPREITTLLAAIWQDTAGPADESAAA